MASERHVEDMLRPIAPVYTNNISQRRGVGSWKNKTIILKNWLEREKREWTKGEAE